MKHLQLTILLASVFAFGTAGASTLTAEDVLAAIDGEAEVETLMSEDMNSERINFDISADDFSTDSFWKPVNAGLLDDTYY